MSDGIADPVFRLAVELLDEGDPVGLAAHLAANPQVVRQRIDFPREAYFQNPSLLEFAAENPVRRGCLPTKILSTMQVVLDAGADSAAINATLILTASGRVPRECGVQPAIIGLLCRYGADPNCALPSALAHGEFAAVEALIAKGAAVSLPVAAALGWTGQVKELLKTASAEDRHRALALGAQFGHLPVVKLLLAAGEDPNRFNPEGFHSHSTPLHQAAFAGHTEVVRLLAEQGADPSVRDKIWNGTPADWARHAHR